MDLPCILHRFYNVWDYLVSFTDSPYRSQTLHETYPYDITVTRRQEEGFGFVIISSVTRSGSTIGEFIGTSLRCGILFIGCLPPPPPPPPPCFSRRGRGRR